MGLVARPLEGIVQSPQTSSGVGLGLALGVRPVKDSGLGLGIRQVAVPNLDLRIRPVEEAPRLVLGIK